MNTHGPCLPLRSRLNTAFSLLELTGVLALIAIMAALVAENVIEKLKRATRQGESVSLASFARALTNRVIRDRAIPATSTLPQLLATELSLAPTRVTTTDNGNSRLFLFDPACRIGTNSTAIPPYAQTALGSVQPVSPRLLMLASVGKTLPSISLNATTFSNLWQTAEESVPADWSSDWAPHAKDLKLQRVDLGFLFHRVVLNNHDAIRVARYSIDQTNTLTFVTQNGRIEAWFLHGSSINFHYNDGTLQAREFIHEDVSYVYENGRWGRYLWYGKNSLNGAFGQMVDAFLAASPPSSPDFYATQQSVVDDMYAYLWYFGLWAYDGFPPEQNPAQPQIPQFRVAIDAQDRMGDFSDNLIR